MDAEQTDFDNPQPTSQEDGTVDSIANGIMDLLDNTAPGTSGTVTPTEPDAETDGDTPDPPDETGGDDPEKYVIKWQGQEREVTQAELLDLAQKGYDYTAKTQTLAQERDQLAPYVGLANLIKSDPVKANQIAAILAGQPQQAPVQKPTFDDPIEQLKWETKQEVLADFRKEMAAQVVPIHRQQALNQVKQQVQSDPDYAVVHQAIVDMVRSQPPAIQKSMFLQLDQDPASYVEAFQFHKQRLQKPAATAEPPRPVKKETRAPILEAGGVAAPDGIEGKAKQERITKMKAKALRSGDPTEISKWLQASGAIDHLY